MVAKLALKKQLLNLQDLWRTSSYVPRCHTVKYLNNSCLLSSKTHAGHHGTSFLELTEPLLRNPPQGQPWWRSLKTPVWVPPRLRTLEPFHPPALGSGFSQSRRAKYQRYWGIENRFNDLPRCTFGGFLLKNQINKSARSSHLKTQARQLSRHHFASSARRPLRSQACSLLNK